MGFKLTMLKFDNILKKLFEKYEIYGPTRVKKKGVYSGTDLITYGKISSFEDLELKEKSRFSPKEVIYPITQTLFYFTEDEYKEPKGPEKDVIVFLRPCDANAFKKLDNIFLKNGDHEDCYYKKAREKLKLFVMECTEGFDSCFCVSMGSNEFRDYDVFIRFEGKKVLLDIKSDEFMSFFEDEEKIDFVPRFIQENDTKIFLPDIDKISENLEEVFKNKMWKEYSERCIACGRCNVSCPTCSCFTMQDIFYTDNPRCGERRRVWASCMVDGFTNVAGGASYRKTHGERMRFKVMHKVYDYKKRFGELMCVGCGRCNDVCPEYISFSNIINKLHDMFEGGKKND